jgi:hypothetical protein
VGSFKQATGSSLKQSAVSSSPAALSKPLEVLEDIVGSSLTSRRRGIEHADGDTPLDGGVTAAEAAAEVKIKGSSIGWLAVSVFDDGKSRSLDGPLEYGRQSVSECM